MNERRKHATARGTSIQPDRYNGFNDTSYACVDFETDGPRVTAFLIDQEGFYVRRTVVADCRTHQAAINYCRTHNEAVSVKGGGE
jgi:hypothetical protein